MRALVARDAAEREQEILLPSRADPPDEEHADSDHRDSRAEHPRRTSLEQAAQATDSWLAVYARVHDLFTEGAWSDADPPPGGGPAPLALHTDGPQQAGVTVSGPELCIAWKSEADCFALYLDRAPDSPPISGEPALDFRSTLTDRIVHAYFSGYAEKTFHPGGLHYTLRGTITGTRR